MKIVHTTGNAALLMLRRTHEDPVSTPPSLARPDPASRDARAAGRSTDAKAQAAATAALFRVNRATGEARLIQRAEQLGDVLGLDRSSYKTFADFSATIREIMVGLTATPGGAKMIDAIATRIKLDAETVAALREQKTPDQLFRLIEKHLALDQLGLSLTRLVSAMQDQKGRETGTLVEILGRDQGLPAKDGTGQMPALVTTDDVGLYRVAAGPGA
jgi:hypothetical protein